MDQIKQLVLTKRDLVSQLVEPDRQVGEGDAVGDREAEDKALGALVAHLSEVGKTLLTCGVPQL